MKISKIVCKYVGLIIRNSKSMFFYDSTDDEGHIFIRRDMKKGFKINDQYLQLFLSGYKATGDFGVTKGTFWLERDSK